MVPRLAIVSGQRRRAAVRYSLRLPVIFRWSDETGDHTEGGFTRDVALDGVFIVSSKCPPIGSDVRIEVLFPSPNEGNGEMRIECIGKVMRAVNNSTCTGFGVWGQFDDDHLTQYVPMRRQSELGRLDPGLNKVDAGMRRRGLKAP